MRKTLMLALCLCLLFCMSVAASAATGELIDVSGGTGGTAQTPGDGGGSETPPPEPEKETKYIITIAAPRGWYTKSAAVTVKFEDVNGTGFDKAEAKLGQNGAWQDISDSLRSYGQAQVDISDNGTVYVAVTDKKGKAHVKSLYVECFDREAPTIRAKVDGRTLRAEADDALSGVETIYVNGYSFDGLTNGTLDIRLKEYTETDEEDVFVYAVDYAGNRSKTVSVKNPYYSPPSSSKPETSQQATTPPATTAPVTQPPATSQPAATPPAASQPAATAPPKTETPKQETEQPAASGDADNGSVTPTDGTGTVIENSVKTPDQREFFTISTEAGNDYYIVVDKQKSDKNVYLLSEVTEDDLTGLAKKSDGTTEIPPVEPLPEVKPEPEAEPEPDPEPAEPEPAPPAKSDAGMYAVVLILALAFGGGAYYFKIVRPKKNAAYPDEDEDMDEDMDGGEDEYPEYPEYPDDGLYFPGDFPESDYEGGAGEDYGQPGEESGE